MIKELRERASLAARTCIACSMLGWEEPAVFFRDKTIYLLAIVLRLIANEGRKDNRRASY